MTSGTFHAVRTRDASALSRDGQAFTKATYFGLAADGTLYEVTFPDGEIILAVSDDLTWNYGQLRAANCINPEAYMADSIAQQIHDAETEQRDRALGAPWL